MGGGGVVGVLGPAESPPPGVLHHLLEHRLQHRPSSWDQRLSYLHVSRSVFPEICPPRLEKRREGVCGDLLVALFVPECNEPRH